MQRVNRSAPHTWREKSTNKTATWYLATDKEGNVYVIISCKSGKGDEGRTSSNYGRTQFVQFIQKRLDDLKVRYILAHEAFIRKKEIGDNGAQRKKLPTGNFSLAFRFPGMTKELAFCLCGGASETTFKEEKEKFARKQLESSLEDLENEQKEARKTYISTTTRRNATATAAAKERDGFACQYCGCSNTFTTADGKPYVEVHHLKYVSEGGSDVLDNLVCLCAHHHSMIHYADVDTREKMTQDLKEQIRKRQ